MTYCSVVVVVVIGDDGVFFSATFFADPPGKNVEPQTKADSVSQ